MFMSSALAQTADAAAAAPGGNEFLMQLPLLAAIFGVFYLLMIRPQKKRMEEHKNKLAGLNKGDRIATVGGLIGVITKLTDEEITLKIDENVQVKVVRSMVADVLESKGGAKPAKADTEKSGDDEEGEGKSESLKKLLSK
jgi:preprotein translocase subunit YajC